jgi:acyl carrier protein
MAQPAERIRDFLIEEGNWESPRADLTDDLALIEGRVIDSMLLLRLVAWLEAEYGIAFDDAEIVPGNFGSIERISKLVSGKLERSAGE